MMGRTHALTGALGGFGLCHLAATTGTPVSALQTVLVVAVTAGAAMLPDLDHPQSTISRALGPVTGVLAHVTARVSGGHRNGTHSLIGIAATGLVTLAASIAGPLTLTIWATFLIAIGSWALMPRRAGGAVAHTLTCLILGGVAIGSAATSAPPPGLMVAATTTGVAIHIVGDMLTVEGCPLLWPATPRLGLPLLSTEGLVERFLVVPATGVAVGIAAWLQLHTTLPDELTHHAEQLADTLAAWSNR